MSPASKKLAASPIEISCVKKHIAPRLLGIPEAAIYISATNWFVEELIRNNEIRAIVIGKGRKLDIRDLDAWIDAEQQKQAMNPPAPIGFAKTSRRLGRAA